MELCKIYILIISTLSSTSMTFTWAASINSVDGLDDEMIQKWTTNAMKFFDFHRCKQLNTVEEGECFKLHQVPKSSIAVYIGRAKVDNNDDSSTFLYHHQAMVVGKGGGGHGRKKVYAILPDSVNQKESKAHDVVLALDPYPTSNFGHVVGLFYIDFGVEERFCKEQQHQIMIADQTCITVAKKSRCPNLLERNISFLPRRCHIDFLPAVHLAGLNHGTILGSTKGGGGGDSGSHTDLLECVRLPGFAACPKLRTLQETEKSFFEPSVVNSRRLSSSLLSTCKLFQTCDRAVLIGGGWSRVHSGTQSLHHIIKMDDMLQRNGFQADNIKMFYANGGQHGIGESKLILPSSMKSGLRGHLRSICETRHCADTLFVYLNNPTTVEGDMLLWDVDKNGIADELETYKIKEFLSDLSQCEAKRIVIVADQSNSDILVNLLKQSSDHPNVILFTSGLTAEVSTNGELTDIWANHSYSTSSLSHLKDTCNIKMKDSTAIVYDSSFGNLLKLSMIGAPCDLNPPLSTRELRSLYQGCQNVPTSVWFSVLGLTDEDEDDGDDGDDESDENSSETNNRRVAR